MNQNEWKAQLESPALIKGRVCCRGVKFDSVSTVEGRVGVPGCGSKQDSFCENLIYELLPFSMVQVGLEQTTSQLTSLPEYVVHPRLPCPPPGWLAGQDLYLHKRGSVSAPPRCGGRLQEKCPARAFDSPRTRWLPRR